MELGSACFNIRITGRQDQLTIDCSLPESYIYATVEAASLKDREILLPNYPDTSSYTTGHLDSTILQEKQWSEYSITLFDKNPDKNDTIFWAAHHVSVTQSTVDQDKIGDLTPLFYE